MTKKTLCLLAGLLLTDALSAQKRGRYNEPPTIEQCLKEYRFSEAEEMLNKQIATLRRRRQSTEKEERQLAAAIKAEHMMNATEKVTFVDSFVVDKGAFLNAFRISPENGQLFTYEQFFNQQKANGCTVYLSELGNKIYFSQPDGQGKTHLYTSDLIDRTWTPPTKLNGLDGSEAENYPFMLSDGVTLYYAAQGEESLGGYDIFVSRYDTDEQTFLRPENIGMPFNSTANDYMYALDEVHNLGWFVSDRFQPTGKVCVYIFIPNEVREVYNVADTGEDKLRRLARATSIAETWHNASALQAARDRLAEARSHKQTQQRLKDFDFIINDRTTYSLIGDFKSPTARKLIIDWKIGLENWKKGNEQLQTLRDAYATGNDGQKKRMSTQILTMEKAQEALTTRLKEMEKTIRNEENAFLNKHIR